jgi:hypothetical protein
VISFDLVIWLVLTTIPFALAPNPKRQMSFILGQVLVPPSFLNLCNALIFPSLPLINATVSSSLIGSFIYSIFDFWVLMALPKNAIFAFAESELPNAIKWVDQLVWSLILLLWFLFATI